MKSRIGQDGHTLQFIQRPVEDVQVHLLTDAGQCASIGMLPELPFTLIAHRIHVIMGYPIRIRIKYRIVQVTFLELIRSIKNGLYVIMPLYQAKPRLHPFPKLPFVIAHLLNIEHRREVARFEFDRTDKERRLARRVGLGIEEMIRPADKPMPACKVEITRESSVAEISSFRGFHKDETDGERSVLGLPELFPVDVPLVMGNIEPVDGIPCRKAYAVRFRAIARLPAIGIRADEEIIETDNEQSGYAPHRHIPHPARHVPDAFLPAPAFLSRGLSLPASPTCAPW